MFFQFERGFAVHLWCYGDALGCLAPPDNPLSFPTLTGLSVGEFAAEYFSSLPPFLNGTGIQSLNCRNGVIGHDEVSALAACATVRKLTLANCGVEDDAAIGLVRMPKLDDLELEGNRLGGEGFQCIAEITALERLTVAHQPVDADAVGALSGLRNLKHLRLVSADIPGDAVRHLATMTWLNGIDLLLNPLTARDIAPLAALPAVRTLVLGDTRIGDAGIAGVVTHMPSVRALDVSNCGLTTRCLPALAQMGQLQNLDLSGNYIGDAGARLLADLPMRSLQQLRLADCGVGTEGAKALGRGTTLPAAAVSVALKTAGYDALGELIYRSPQMTENPRGTRTR